jgi:hypothetical protein
MPFQFRRQPFKAMYWLYFAFEIFTTSLLWTTLWIFPLMRPRKSWSLKRTLYTAYLRRLVYAAMRTDLGFTTVAPPTREDDIQKTGFIWIQPIPEVFVPREVVEMAKNNNIKPVCVGGYWYGERDGEGKVGQKAEPGEKVLFVLHGKFVHP